MVVHGTVWLQEINNYKKASGQSTSNFHVIKAFSLDLFFSV